MAPRGAERPDTSVERRELRVPDTPPARRRRRRGREPVQQPADLRQREPARLRQAHEGQAVERGGVVAPLAPDPACARREESPPLVVADRRDVDVGLPGELSDAHACAPLILNHGSGATVVPAAMVPSETRGRNVWPWYAR